MTSCGADQDANLAKGETFCRRAKLMGADVALFPEMWSNGYPDLNGRAAAVRAGCFAAVLGTRHGVVPTGNANRW